MADLDKVIKGLECCSTRDCYAGICPYYDDGVDIEDCTSELAADALELLKAQEPKHPNLVQDVSGIYIACPRCGKKIQAWLAKEILELSMPKFCKHCGQAVKCDIEQDPPKEET